MQKSEFLHFLQTGISFDFRPAETGFHDIYPAERPGKEPLPAKEKKMAFDGIVTAAVVRDLKEKLTGGRIDRIYQPSTDEIILQIRKGRDKYRLYVSANTSHAGLYLISEKDTNPQNPPAFCMLLRKHMQSARIRAVCQVESERIVEIDTDAVNELGFAVNHRLTVEIMGKHSNIILIDINTGKIIDAVKRLSLDVNRYRQILPGALYVSPPSHGKIPYFDLSRERFREVMLPSKGLNLDKALVSTIQGISPVFASELLYRADIYGSDPDESHIDRLYDELMSAVREASEGPGLPCVYIDRRTGAPCEFHALDLTILAGRFDRRTTEDISAACDLYFEGRDSSNRIRQKSSDIRRAVSRALDRLLLKKQRLGEDLLQAEDSEKYRLYGELLTASLHKVTEGRHFAEVENYYDGTILKIPLDPRYSPAVNAQRYFKKYSKSKTAVIEKQRQLEETSREIDYLESVVTFVHNAVTSEDLDDIRSELADNGYMKPRHTRGRQKKQKLHPHRYTLASGLEAAAGRNNIENDQLTFKKASSGDIWMHAKDIPGSHVIVFTGGRPLTAEEIHEAASIAAYHSKARQSENVPVDYVNVRHVRKPNGSRPGFVTFTHNRTVYANPVLPESGGEDTEIKS